MPGIFNNAAKELTGIQSSIAGRENVKRTGYLSDYLSAGPFHASKQGDDAVLAITYPIYTRFLDLRRGRNGKPKKFVPIYNKYVWGFLMGYIYNRTRGGIARLVAEKLKSQTIEI